MMCWLKVFFIYEIGIVNDIFFLCNDSVGIMMLLDM